MRLTYLDTVVETKERLTLARQNINIFAIVMAVSYVIYTIVGLLVFLSGSASLGTFVLVYSVFFLVLFVAFVIKREIYSLAILIKKQQEE